MDYINAYLETEKKRFKFFFAEVKLIHPLPFLE